MAKNNQSRALPQDTAAITDDQHSSLISWVNEADDATLTSRAESERARDYYDSKQWTDAEKKKLQKQKQAATVRNRIKPKIDGLLGMEKSNKTTAKAFPRTPKHANAATAVTEAVKFCLQDNFYDQIRSAAWENLLLEGTCGTEIIVKKQKGEPRITMNHIKWDRLIYDPHSRFKDFSDAKYLGQFVWMDYEDAARKYPNAKDVLDTMVSGSSTYDDKPKWMDNNRRRVKIVELYWKDGGDVYYSCFTRGGYCETPRISPYKNEEGETVWPYEFASLFIDRDGGRYGACLQLMDIQDEINKRGSKALHLMSVRQVRGERGAVEDVNKARAELAKPDGYIETTPGMEFEILKTGDMAAAQFQLLAEAKAEIDAVSYNAAAAGKETRMMSGVALRNREAASQTELAPMFDVLRHLDIRVYRKTWNLVQQYWKDEKWIRVTDNDNNLRWVGLNKPITKGEQVLKQAQEQGAGQQQIQQLQMQIQQDPMMQEVIDTENDIVNLDMDIVMSDAPDTLTTQIEDFQVLGEMVKSGFQMPPIAVIKASPLSNKDELIKMMQEQPQLSPQHQQQMQQMQEQMQKIQEEAQKLAQENQQLKMGQQEAQMKVQAGMQESQMKLEAKKQEVAMEMQLKSEIQAQELQLERERASATIQLEREKAQAQIELQALKLQTDNQHNVEKLQFDQQCKMHDMQKQTDMENSAAENQMMPQVMETLQGMIEQFSQVVKDQKAFQSEIAAALTKPKKIQLQKDSEGRPTSATVS